ncbi:restriction endonuclease [Roseomonas sp. SSH11]|uniref:Restriction endonuclease n=1 Tax=Pararoseomonas baculiformis TaxID=2820812 RepID=A0ABS4ACT7_9PROT|nr:restriction endonuclease [Pararoseomonas baculiformis]MBP0444814.1 restriction endonuclease [Pararoseomonas baculiformis]
MGVLLAAIALLLLAAVLVIAHGLPVEEAPKAGKPAAAPGLTPREFEQHCADALAARGWNVSVGRGSGDQGVDVLARKGGRKVVLQCKLYNRPVGNKAVQEALAGRGYAGADGAAVVSNAAYTAAAHALAARVGVLLLHVSDLSRADTLFQFPASPVPPGEEPTRARRRRARRGGGTAAWRPALRLLLRPVPAAVFAGFILLFPRLPAERAEAPELRRAARPVLPLPPPPPPSRHASR